MEVPPQRRPQHHGNLARRAARRTEVVGGRVGDGRDEEVIIPQGRSLEAMHMTLLWRSRTWAWVGHVLRIGGGMSCGRGFGEIVLVIVLAVQDDGPSRREETVVSTELVRFELDTPKDRRDGKGLTVWEMDYGMAHLR